MKHKLGIPKLNNMKRYLLIFALLLGTVSSWGQTVADKAAVLQKCIDLPALESAYAVDASGNPEIGRASCSERV